ncbi:signal transduction histidine kinase [Runella defluvii]|uniref:histidine kinase n=1 Tax=Runella defluvii TaxID=370973 RepID=A0A7W6EQA8_9BACT|nr:HAMP domain-containing sensor histidine kinase [Runella defluvii]MBB3838216.1 signal transduction histidine kinase [Runella defluvii]HAK80080.1 two-component sensor histidine kinase [Runella sp.]HAO48853.1 two-component sensor histidine kinase [Runella sp.]
MKTQLKIALFLIFTNSLMLLLFGGSIYYFLYNYSYTDFYKRLETRATIAAKYNFDADKINAEPFKIIRKEHLEKLSAEKEYLYRVENNNDLAEMAQKSELPMAFLKEILNKGKATRQMDETFFTGIRHESKNQTHIVVVSAKNYYASNHLLFMRNVILLGVLLIALITTYLSFFFSRRIFDPIKHITDRVKQISKDNIHLRIEEKKNDAEISQLISTFNDLLNRLETSFETQNNFVSNASHEFGTPLTSIMGEAEVMLMKQRSPEEYQQSLMSILGQAERLNQITQTLLYLAQTGYTNKRVNFEILRTDDLIWQVKEMIDKLNPKNNIQVDFSLLPENPKKLKVMGNRQLLSLAFTNILTNACKYSNNKPVVVTIASSDDQVFLAFTDHGIGIPESELPFIYDPFFRASNTRNFEGYGIGLPLTRNIIKIHNGQLQLSSVVNEGTTVQIRIPLAKIP